MGSQSGIDAHQLCIDHINRHFNELVADEPENFPPMAWTKDWIVVSYDSSAGETEAHMARTMVLDLNDDGYFVTFFAHFHWDDDYELVAMGYHGDEDEGMQIISIPVDS